jgi:hypothetical protein
MRELYLIVLAMLLLSSEICAQTLDSAPSDLPQCLSLVHAPTDADSLYILQYCKKNDIRLLLGAQGSSLAYGSKKEEGDGYNDAIYHNVNDLAVSGLPINGLILI